MLLLLFYTRLALRFPFFAAAHGYGCCCCCCLALGLLFCCLCCCLCCSARQRWITRTELWAFDRITFCQRGAARRSRRMTSFSLYTEKISDHAHRTAFWWWFRVRVRLCMCTCTCTCACLCVCECEWVTLLLRWAHESERDGWQCALLKVQLTYSVTRCK